jgi:hypothetical protein
MAYEHNDIVTVNRMNEAIAEGGGGGGDDVLIINAQVTQAGGGEYTAELVGITAEEVLAKAATGVTCIAHVASLMPDGFVANYVTFFMDYTAMYQVLSGVKYRSTNNGMSGWTSFTITASNVAFTNTDFS